MRGRAIAFKIFACSLLSNFGSATPRAADSTSALQELRRAKVTNILLCA
jgi:hypothetical protein